MEYLLLKEDVAEAALWARAAFDQDFLKNAHKVWNISESDNSSTGS